MVQLNGLTVEFLINGQPAVEHEVPEAKDGSLQDEVSRYIEAHDGGSFAFRCTTPVSYVVSRSSDELSFKLYLDGIWRRWITSKPSPIKKKTIDIDGGYYETSTGPSLKVFKFANLHIHGRKTDPAAISERWHDLLSVGLARIEVWRNGEKQGSKLKSRHPGRNAEEARGLKVHETAARARVNEGVLMGVEMGDVVRGGPNRGRRNTKKLDSKPIATFKFKYGSKGAMQQLGIIEPTPPPPPPLEQRDPATLTHEESREALRRLQLQLQHTSASGVVKAEMASGGLKRERGTEDNAHTDRPVKRERAEVIEIEDDD